MAKARNRTLRLILAVKDHPILYDTTLSDNKNTHEKKLVWQKIANEVGVTDGTIIRWKWKNLRDSYAKHLRSQKEQFNDEVEHRLLNWQWAQHMKFLEPFMKKPVEYNDCNADNTLPCTSVDKKSKKYAQINQNIMTENNADFSMQGNLKDDNNQMVCVESTESPSPIINNVESLKQDRYTIVERLDKTDYLFLSYADTFKKFSPRRQAMLKLQMAKIFAEVELEELSQDPIKIEL